MVITTNIGLSTRVNRTCSSTHILTQLSFLFPFCPSHSSPLIPHFSFSVPILSSFPLVACPLSPPYTPHTRILSSTFLCHFVVVVFFVVFVVGPASPGRRFCSLVFFPLFFISLPTLSFTELCFGSSLSSLAVAWSLFSSHSAPFLHFSELFRPVSGSPLTRGAQRFLFPPPHSSCER